MVSTMVESISSSERVKFVTFEGQQTLVVTVDYTRLLGEGAFGRVYFATGPD